MNKQIMTIIFGMILVISLISLVSASSSSKIRISYEEDDWDLTFFSGETIINEFEVCNEYNEDKEIELDYEIEGNSSDLEGITFEFSDDNFDLDEDDCKDIDFTIISQPNYKPDSYTITISAETDDIDEDDEDGYWFYGECKWECGAWTSCINGKKTRICKKTTMFCSIVDEKPDEVKDCEDVIIIDGDEDVIIPDDTDEEDNKVLIWIIVILILIVLGIIILICFLTKNKKNKDEETSDEEEESDEESSPPENFPTSTAKEILEDKTGIKDVEHFLQEEKDESN